MIEEWRLIPGYDGRYEISNYGKVRNISKRHPRELKPVVTPHGHYVVKLYLFGFGTTKRLHVLVWTIFIGGDPIAVYHRDNDLANNRLDNLTVERGQNA